MNDNYMITVIGTQTVDGESDSIEVITCGDYVREDLVRDLLSVYLHPLVEAVEIG